MRVGQAFAARQEVRVGGRRAGAGGAHAAAAL